MKKSSSSTHTSAFRDVVLSPLLPPPMPPLALKKGESAPDLVSDAAIHQTKLYYQLYEAYVAESYRLRGIHITAGLRDPNKELVVTHNDTGLPALVKASLAPDQDLLYFKSPTPVAKSASKEKAKEPVFSYPGAKTVNKSPSPKAIRRQAKRLNAKISLVKTKTALARTELSYAKVVKTGIPTPPKVQPSAQPSSSDVNKTTNAKERRKAKRATPDAPPAVVPTPAKEPAPVVEANPSVATPVRAPQVIPPAPSVTKSAPASGGVLLGKPKPSTSGPSTGPPQKPPKSVFTEANYKRLSVLESYLQPGSNVVFTERHRKELQALQAKFHNR